MHRRLADAGSRCADVLRLQDNGGHAVSRAAGLTSGLPRHLEGAADPDRGLGDFCVSGRVCGRLKCRSMRRIGCGRRRRRRRRCRLSCGRRRRRDCRRCRCRRRRRRRRSWRGRRRGCRRRVGGNPRRKQRKGIDVRVAFPHANPEMHVGHVVLGGTGGARLSDRVSFPDTCSALHEQRAEMGEGYLVPVAGHDRHGEAVRRDRTGERELARRRGAHDPTVLDSDIDPAMLTRRVRVAADRELAQNRAVRRPCPGQRVGCSDECPGNHPQYCEQTSRCLSCEHDPRVAPRRRGGQRVDEVVTERSGRACFGGSH